MENWGGEGRNLNFKTIDGGGGKKGEGGSLRKRKRKGTRQKINEREGTEGTARKETRLLEEEKKKGEPGGGIEYVAAIQALGHSKEKEQKRNIRGSSG